MLLLTTRGGTRYRKLPEGTITPLRQAQQTEHEGNPLASLTKRIRVMRMRDETVAPDPPKIRGPRDMRAIQPRPGLSCASRQAPTCFSRL